MTNLECISDEELARVTQLTCPRIPAKKLREATWKIDRRLNITRIRALTATIDGQTIMACLYPTRVGLPNHTTSYEIGWIAPESTARKLFNS